MKTYTCIKDESFEGVGNYKVILNYDEEPKKFSVGFAKGYDFYEGEDLSEDSIYFEKVEFEEYLCFRTYEDAYLSIVNEGYPFNTKNCIEEE